MAMPATASIRKPTAPSPAIPGVSVVRRAAPTTTPTLDLTSATEAVFAFGEASQAFVTLPAIQDTLATQFPFASATRIIAMAASDSGPQGRYSTIAHGLKDFLNGVKVLKDLGTEDTWAPIAQIHRPNAPGCKATYDFEATREAAAEISLKVFGFGGGLGKSRSYTFHDTVSTTTECLLARVGLQLHWEHCRGPDGIEFNRATVLSLSDDYDVSPAHGPDDLCGWDATKVKAAGWTTSTYDLPAGATASPRLAINTGQTTEFSLTSKFNGAEVGPKVSVKRTSQAQYQYELAGGHKYLAYAPKGHLCYYWTLQ